MTTLSVYKTEQETQPMTGYSCMITRPDKHEVRLWTGHVMCTSSDTNIFQAIDYMSSNDQALFLELNGKRGFLFLISCMTIDVQGIDYKGHTGSSLSARLFAEIWQQHLCRDTGEMPDVSPNGIPIPYGYDLVTDTSYLPDSHSASY